MPVLKERHSLKQPDEVVKLNDSVLLLEHGGAAGLRVALDPTGQSASSEELAALLTTWENQSVGTVCFLIGGHLGLHRSVLQQADMVLSLSRLTFTHEMTRLLLVEQLYRACTIKAGHRYHK
jgi:23S rRNA (pseudouridine1915-N3)-methyltransferase